MAEMYVVRIGSESRGYAASNPAFLKLSRPCEGCTRGILHRNIGKVYYSWSEIPSSEINPKYRNINNYKWIA